MSVDVERVFSKGRILLSHVQYHLASQTICALMCLGRWSLMGYIRSSDLIAVTKLAETKDVEMEDGWDKIMD